MILTSEIFHLLSFHNQRLLYYILEGRFFWRTNLQQKQILYAWTNIVKLKPKLLLSCKTHAPPTQSAAEGTCYPNLSLLSHHFCSVLSFKLPKISKSGFMCLKEAITCHFHRVTVWWVTLLFDLNLVDNFTNGIESKAKEPAAL